VARLGQARRVAAKLCRGCRTRLPDTSGGAVGLTAAKLDTTGKGSMTIVDNATVHSDASKKEVLDWADLGKEMWSDLTGRGAAIDYQFVDMFVEVPRDTSPDAARATWRLNGTLRITTSENATTAQQ